VSTPGADLRTVESRRRDEQYVRYVTTLVHRVLANHRPYERCAECPSGGSRGRGGGSYMVRDGFLRAQG
jgi:hypothetical protein